jgi:hypothetical protein
MSSNLLTGGLQAALALEQQLDGLFAQGKMDYEVIQYGCLDPGFDDSTATSPDDLNRPAAPGESMGRGVMPVHDTDDCNAVLVFQVPGVGLKIINAADVKTAFDTGGPDAVNSLVSEF